MAKKTALKELRDSIKRSIPAAGTSEELLLKQREFSWLVYEIDKDCIPKEKQQLRDAFNKGIVYGLLLSTSNSKDEDTKSGFDRYYKDRYEDEA